MTSYWNPDYVEHASCRYTTFRLVVYFILNCDNAKASENQNITFENTLASLVLKRLHNIQKHLASPELKRLHVHFTLSGSAVATGGARGAVPPLTAACAFPFWFTQNTTFGTSRNDNATDNDGKRNNYVQT